MQGTTEPSVVDAMIKTLVMLLHQNHGKWPGFLLPSWLMSSEGYENNEAEVRRPVIDE
jgi:hypothetical protein